MIYKGIILFFTFVAGFVVASVLACARLCELEDHLSEMHKDLLKLRKRVEYAGKSLDN